MKLNNVLVVGVVVIALTVAAGVHAEVIVDETHVLKLTSKDFDEKRAESEYMLIEFLAPWCGNCVNLKPAYAAAATKLFEENISKDLVQLATVNCVDDKAVCDKYLIKGYPTLKWFKKGSDDPDEVHVERTADAIAEYVKRFSGPVLTELGDLEEITKFSKSSSVVLVAFLDASDDATRTIYEEAAESLREEASFGVASDSLAKEFGAASTPALVIFLSFADEPAVREGKLTTPEDVAAFIRLESFPLVQEISQANYGSYVKRNLPLVWNFLEKDGRDENIAKLKEAAVDSKGRLSWVWLDATSYGMQAQKLGLSDKYPGSVVEDSNSRKKYIYPDDGAFESEALRSWAADVLAGNVEPYLKSEPVPEVFNNTLTKVVGKNYESIVLDDSKDVLLEFYAPWCRFCTELAPTYEKLAVTFENDSNVVIANVDATANDMPIDVQGFPTIFFFPAGSKDEPISYEGKREFKDLVAFVVEHSATLSDERKKSVTEAEATAEEAASDTAQDDASESDEQEHEL